MRWYVDVLLKALGESALFALGSAGGAAVGQVVWSVPILDGIGLILLVLGAGLMLVGGALSFMTPGNVRVFSALFGRKVDPSRDDYESAKHKAALYSMTGFLLFAYSLIMAVAFQVI